MNTTREDLARELRDYADAVDKDRGFRTGLTDTMRDAAKELIEAREQARAHQERADRLLYLAEHLFQMVTPQVWRDSGGDDGQGHYEGEYLAEKLCEELAEHRAALAVDTKEAEA